MQLRLRNIVKGFLMEGSSGASLTVSFDSVEEAVKERQEAGKSMYHTGTHQTPQDRRRKNPKGRFKRSQSAVWSRSAWLIWQYRFAISFWAACSPHGRIEAFFWRLQLDCRPMCLFTKSPLTDSQHLASGQIVCFYWGRLSKLFAGHSALRDLKMLYHCAAIALKLFKL